MKKVKDEGKEGSGVDKNEFKEMMSKYKLLHPGQAEVGFGSGVKRNLTSNQKLGGKRPPT